MNFRAVSTILGTLLIVLSAFIFIFYLIAYFLYPQENEYNSFFSSFIITFIIGIIMVWWGGNVSEDDVTIREGFAITGLIWIVMAFFGSLPLYLSGSIPSLVDAYFESMSGFTTTGASILSDIEKLGHTALLWRSFTHWLGGMGIIVLSLAILPALGVGGMQLFKAEATGPTVEKLLPQIGHTARMLYLVYTLVTVIQTFLLWGTGMNLFESLCHTFGSVGTGGFSPFNSSIGQYTKNNPGMAFTYEQIITFFMAFCGVNFALHYKAILKGDIFTYFKDSEFRFYIGLIFLAIITIGINLYYQGGYNNLFTIYRDASFTVVSIITTTGYMTVDFDKWPDYSKYVLFLLMFVGGMAGSTGGGIKVVRIMILIKEIFIEVLHNIHPKRVYVIKLGKSYISRDVLYSINVFILTYVVIYFLSILILSFTGNDFHSTSSMVIACLSNVGPGFGSVGPTHNFGFLPDYAKWILSFLMALGRLELYPLLVLSLPGLWSK